MPRRAARAAGPREPGELHGADFMPFGLGGRRLGGCFRLSGGQSRRGLCSMCPWWAWYRALSASRASRALRGGVARTATLSARAARSAPASRRWRGPRSKRVDGAPLVKVRLVAQAGTHRSPSAARRVARSGETRTDVGERVQVRHDLVVILALGQGLRRPRGSPILILGAGLLHAIDHGDRAVGPPHSFCWSIYDKGFG